MDDVLVIELAALIGALAVVPLAFELFNFLLELIGSAL